MAQHGEPSNNVHTSEIITEWHLEKKHWYYGVAVAREYSYWPANARERERERESRLAVIVEQQQHFCPKPRYAKGKAVLCSFSPIA